MANTFIPKRSSVPGKVPLASDLQIGELAVNLADSKIYTKNSNGDVIELANAEVTSTNIIAALGYTPADAAVLGDIQAALDAINGV